MRGTREPTHVRANLGDQHFRALLLMTGDGAEQLKLLLERGHDLVDLQIEALERFIEIINVRKELTHDDSVITEELSFECFPQGRNLGLQPALGELGQDLRVVRSSDQGLEHEPARDSQHLGCHRGLRPGDCQARWPAWASPCYRDSGAPAAEPRCSGCG